MLYEDSLNTRLFMFLAEAERPKMSETAKACFCERVLRRQVIFVPGGAVRVAGVLLSPLQAGES